MPVHGTQARRLRSEQAQAEDRTAMGVDAAGGAQHRRFGRDAELAQLLERRVVDTGLCNRDEIAAQGEQAAQKCRRIHIGMAAAVERRDQAGFGRAAEFRMQGGDRQPTQPMRQCAGSAGFRMRCVLSGCTVLQLAMRACNARWRMHAVRTIVCGGKVQ